MYISFCQYREIIIDHSSDIDKNVLNTSCFDAPYGNEEYYSECCEDIYDDYSNVEDAPLSQSLLNPHDQGQIIFENEENSNSKIVKITSHFQKSNHLPAFNIPEANPIYDSYDDHVLTPIHSPEYFSLSQANVNDHSNCIILASASEKEIVSNQSQLCCNINCNYSVNYELISLFFLHLFCLFLDLFFACIF